MKTSVLILAIPVILYFTGKSEVINVPGDYPTIQGAINIAVDGDTVLVQPGIYIECIDFLGKNIVVASTYLTTGDTLFISQTVIDADYLGSVVTFSNGEENSATLIGFTLMNGTGTSVDMINFGGGIYCFGASPTLNYLRVINNSSSGMGGGVGGGAYFINSQAILKNSIIKGNDAYYGGGIRIDYSEVIIESCWIEDNYAIGSGAGLMFFLCPSSWVTQTVFTGNQAIYGGAICCVESNPVIDRTTCFKNRGLYGGSLNVGAECAPFVINSIFWNNAMHAGTVNEIHLEGYNASLAVAYSDIEGGKDSVNVVMGTLNWLEANMIEYPMFEDTTNLILDLQSQSPCIDEGTALYIYEDDTIVNIANYFGIAPDVGAFEYNPSTSVFENKSVFNFTDLHIQDNVGKRSWIVQLDVHKPQHIALAVYSIDGHCVKMLENRHFAEGAYFFTLNADSWAPGIYVVCLTSDFGISTKKLGVF